jgi:hypothetical protein
LKLKGSRAYPLGFIALEVTLLKQMGGLGGHPPGNAPTKESYITNGNLSPYLSTLLLKLKDSRGL